jgi:hypothetical protein
MAKSAAVRARMKLEGTVQLEYLQKHINEWAKSHPELVRTALWSGVNDLWWAVRQKMGQELRTRTGQLQASIWRDVTTSATGTIDAEVFARPGAGDLQPVKLRALELGSYRQHPGGVPFIWVSGKPRFISKETAEAMERAGHKVPRTKGPYGIRIKARPMFKPTLKKYRIPIAQGILKEILEGFKRERSKNSI